MSKSSTITIVEKPISQITPYEKNPRCNDGGVDKVAESIKAYGWKQPLVIDENGVIIVGHTRYKAAQMLGLKTVPCVVADDLTPEEAKAYRLADNKVADFSFWDNKLLLEELDELDAMADDLFTGFEFSDIFDYTMDEKDNDAILDNEEGIIYEAVFKSEDEEKIKRIKEAWENLQ